MPKNIKEVRKFLEFINYYKRFCKDSKTNKYIDQEECKIAVEEVETSI